MGRSKGRDNDKKLFNNDKNILTGRKLKRYEAKNKLNRPLVNYTPEGKNGTIGEFILLVSLILIIIAGSAGLTYKRGNQITASTHQRQALEANSYIETIWIEDNANWIHGKMKIVDAMTNFANKTGVQPTLIIKNPGENGDFTEEQFKAHIQERYNILCPDEAHLVFGIYDVGDGTYKTEYIIGDLAKTVLDEEAMNILKDYLIYEYEKTIDKEQMFINVFNKSATRIMTVTIPLYMYVFGGFSVIVTIFGIYFVINKKMKQITVSTISE